MEPTEDLRVVRGPDWEHSEDDGGEGHVGTVVQVHRRSDLGEHQASGSDEATDGGARGGEEEAVSASPEAGKVHRATVQWDMGHRGLYECGEDGKYELRIFDTAQTGELCRSVTCDGCKASPLLGTRWKCSQCYDFDLCFSCYMGGKEHSDSHKFVRYDTGQLRSMMACRRGARSVESRGIFPEAEVVRGHDWSWGQQDGGGGTVGKVVSITNWEEKHYRGSVEVEWPEEGSTQYRVGCQGMVDLKCVKAASGGKYYPDHLQVLGAPHCPLDSSEFASSDYVCVELDAEVFEMLQQNHGGWNSAMAGFRGELGVVHSIQDNGDLRISYGQNRWIVNPLAVVKVDVPRYQVGDAVRVMDDRAEVSKLQKNHGGWVEEMSDVVGHLGSVQGVNNDGNVTVLMKARLWTINPLCLRRADKEEEQEVSSSEILGQETPLLELRLQVLVEQEDSELLHHAALLGNLAVIRDYLDKYPNEVNAKLTGKTPLHCAVSAGKTAIVEALLELGANRESEDEVGFKPLHHCAQRELPEMASFLLKAGCDPNSKSHDEQTPLIVAALKGHNKVLTVLLRWPGTRLSEQDRDGDTALHCAIHGRRYQSLCALLEAGADPSLINFSILTPLHLAVKEGFLQAVEKMVKSRPEHVNVRDQQQCTPLHMAVSEGEVEVARTLLDVTETMVDARDDSGHTPLHEAIQKDHSRLVELLIGYGADPTIIDEDEVTPLHLVLDNDDMESPSEDSPELNKVKKLLCDMSSGELSGQVVVACLLVREGADVSFMSGRGETPMDSCSPETAVIVSEFAKKYTGTGRYRGSLRNPQVPTPTNSAENHMNENVVVTEADSKQGPQPSEDKGREQNLVLVPAPNHPLATNGPTSTSSGGDKTTSSSTISPPQPQSSPALTTAETPRLCFLCDLPITVKFEPCGHSPLCKNCGRRARKCPDCKTPVQALSELSL